MNLDLFYESSCLCAVIQLAHLLAWSFSLLEKTKTKEGIKQNKGLSVWTKVITEVKLKLDLKTLSLPLVWYNIVMFVVWQVCSLWRRWFIWTARLHVAVTSYLHSVSISARPGSDAALPLFISLTWYFRSFLDGDEQREQTHPINMNDKTPHRTRCTSYIWSIKFTLWLLNQLLKPTCRAVSLRVSRTKLWECNGPNWKTF